MDALQIGLQLTVAGMGIVFFLLAVMAVLIALLSRWDRAPSETRETPAPAREFPEGLDADALAAITIAVRAHRITRRQQAAPAMRKHQPGTLPSRWVGIGRTRQTSSWRPMRRG
jgi:Na+-transporting methylmalonyl-CoA/oxaloacetate decarboxylase gamma subunit